MTDLAITISNTNRTQRIAVSGVFFLQGLCFASWASRISTIQEQLQWSHGLLGLVLLALPAGSLIGLVLAGWLVTRWGSRRVACGALIAYSGVLILIGWAATAPLLALSLLLFGIAGNCTNIAMNTQAVAVENRYGRKIMASFHGLWSLAGFAAAGAGAWMIGRHIAPLSHFTGVSALIVAGLLLFQAGLVPDAPDSTETTPPFRRPNKALLYLGLIAFCCMLCEGTLFDWSNIYFQKAVGAPPAWVGAGYTAFMLTMATGRFLADRISHRLGVRRTLAWSGGLMTTGLALAVALPNIPFALAGFLLTGFGVSAVVPLVFSEPGRTTRETPGMALAAVSGIGFLGFLAGPPLVGFIAALAGLRCSFALVALVGLCIPFLAVANRTITPKPS